MENTKAKPITINKAEKFLQKHDIEMCFGPKWCYSGNGNPFNKKEEFVTTEECMVEFAKERNKELIDQTTQLREENKKLVERLQKMTYYVKLFTGGGGHPESQCKMEIDKAEQLLNSTSRDQP